MKTLILHSEYQNNYLNKNIGYFIKFCLDKGFEVDFATNHQKDVYDKRFGNKFKVIKTQLLNLKQYDYAWLYPYQQRLIWTLLKLRLNKVKTIVKLDSLNLWSLRTVLIQILAYRIIYENDRQLKGFLKKKKLVKFAGGLSQDNIGLIKSLEKRVKREKIILFSGRLVKQKGFNRLLTAFVKLKRNGLISNEWQLIAIGKNLDNYKSSRTDVKIKAELTGKDYYIQLLKSSLMVLPTYNEGFPNVLSDAYFCKRLFLTTTGAKCWEAILDKTFYCQNSQKAIEGSMQKIISQLDEYYKNYDQLYNQNSFKVADSFWSKLL